MSVSCWPISFSPSLIHIDDRKIAAHRCLREMGADVISSLIANPLLLEDLLLGFSPPTQKGSRDPE